MAVAKSRCRSGTDEHTVDLRQVCDRAQHRAGVDVDLDHLAGAQVGDEQQAAPAVQTRVIEPRIVAGHANSPTGRRGSGGACGDEEWCDVAGERPITTIDTTATATESRASAATTPVPLDIVMRPSTERSVAAAPREPRRPTDSLTFGSRAGVAAEDVFVMLDTVSLADLSVAGGRPFDPPHLRQEGV